MHLIQFVYTVQDNDVFNHFKYEYISATSGTRGEGAYGGLTKHFFSLI